MEEFAAGTDVTLTFDHVYNGNDLTVTDLQYQVIDSQGEELVAFVTAPDFDAANTSTAVTILGSFNAIDDKIDVRQVNVKFVTASGTYKVSVFYKLVGDLTVLTPMEDSFMTFPESMVVRAKMTDSVEFFDALPDALKAVALENAFERIVKLRYNAATGLPASCETGATIEGMSLAAFKNTNPKFQAAIKKAQILEANAMVENSPIRDKIRQGIISETIGESSMFFKQGMIGVTKYPGLSDDAYIYLKDFVFKSARHAQIWKLARA